MTNARARHAAAWASAFGGGAAPAPPAAVRLLDLPGFREFEDRILAHDPRWPWHEYSDPLSIQTFDVAYGETLYYEGLEPQDDWSADLVRSFTQGKRDFENKLEVHRAVYDEDRIAILLRLGIDFRDDHGKPLRCTKAFCRQAEFAIRFRGWKPKHVLKSVNTWANKLEADAAKWSKDRRP